MTSDHYFEAMEARLMSELDATRTATRRATARAVVEDAARCGRTVVLAFVGPSLGLTYCRFIPGPLPAEDAGEVEVWDVDLLEPVTVCLDSVAACRVVSH